MGYELQSVRFMGAVVNHVNTTKNKKFIRIPVPKKKEDATEIPKYLLKITLRKV